VLVGEGEKESAENAKPHGQPIAKNDVHKSERERAGQEHGPTGPEQGLIPVKEKCAVQKFLGIDGQERVEGHHRSPKQRRALHEGKKKVRRENAHCKAEQRQQDRVSKQKHSHVRPEVAPGNKPGGIEGGIMAKDQECGQGGNQQVGNRKIGKDSIEDEQGKANEEEGKL